MKIHKLPGFFMALEGLDGSGSDLVAKALVKKLKAEKMTVIFTKEPSRGPVGKLIKKLLLKKKKSFSPLFLEYLFAADREWQMETKIIPALKEGKIVVADRCLWSSLAYRFPDLPIHWLMEINKHFFIPNLTFFVDTDPSTCAARIKKDKDEVQLYTEEKKLVEIQEGYLWLFNKYPYWFKTVEGNKKTKKTVKEIFDYLFCLQKFQRLKKGKL